jgi:hypothetical protein
MDYKNKYLKYKQKYLNLKNKINKGGVIPGYLSEGLYDSMGKIYIDDDMETALDRISVISTKYKYGVFNIFRIAYNIFVKKKLSKRYNVLLKKLSSHTDYASFHNLLKNTLFLSNSNDYLHYESNTYGLIYFIFALYTKLYITPPYNTQITFNNATDELTLKYSDDTEEILTHRLFLNLYGNTQPFNNINQIISYIDPPDDNIGLIESLLGNMLNLGTNPKIMKEFRDDVIVHRCKSYIVDYQNIYHILRDMFKYSDDTIKLLLRRYFAYLVYGGHYVIIVYKPSSSGHVHHDSLTDDIIYDPLLDYFFDLKNAKNELYDMNIIDDYRPHIILRKKLNKKFFLVNFQSNRRGSSNYDDYIFWVIAISFYNFYQVTIEELHEMEESVVNAENIINNLHILTNDKQKIIQSENSNDKNILNFGQMKFKTNISNYKYINNIVDGVDNIDVIIDNNSVLENYLCSFYECVTYDFIQDVSSGVVNISSLTLRQIYNNIHFVTYDFYMLDVNNYYDVNISYLDAIVNGDEHVFENINFAKNIKKVTFAKTNIEVDINGYLFYYFIKLIQHKIFKYPNGSLDMVIFVEEINNVNNNYVDWIDI